MNEELMKKVKKEFGELNLANLEKHMNEAVILQYYLLPEIKGYVGLFRLDEIYFAVALIPGKNPLMDFADSKHDGIMSFADIFFSLRNDKEANI